MVPELVVGIDLGATKILSGLMTADGEILNRRLVPTYAGSRGAAVIIDQMAASVHEMLLETSCQPGQLRGIACAAPGPITYPGGVVLDSPNLGWRMVELKQELQKRLNHSVLVGKDTDFAALGEYRFGQGCKYGHLLYLTISTGIGGGIIANGRLYQGSRGGAGEFGHMVVNPDGRTCYCGRKGCLEAQASGTAIAQIARDMLAGGKAPVLAQMSYLGITAREVGIAARQGDNDAVALLSGVVTDLASGIANLVQIFNPEIVVLGGSVIQGLKDIMLQPLREQVLGQVFPLHRQGLKIEVTNLGSDIGLYGCLAAIVGAGENDLTQMNTDFNHR